MHEKKRRNIQTNFRLCLKKNEILRQKKLRSLETARAAKERYMREKAAFDAAESDEGMSTPIEPNAVDNAIDEVQAGKDIEV